MTEDASATAECEPGTDSGDPNSPPVRRLADWDANALEALAREYGTPLYVLDTNRVRANYRRLQTTFQRTADRDVRVAYAAKANASPATLSALEAVGADVEVASAAELSAVREVGYPHERVQYTAVNPPAEELGALRRYHDETGGPSVITVGARDTLDRLAQRGYDGPLALRVRPGAGVGHHDAVVTGTDRGFGIALADAPQVLADAADRFEVVGLHAHLGSGVLNEDLDAHAAALARVGTLARRVAGSDGTPLDAPSTRVGPVPEIDLDFVDLGGGLGVPYGSEEAPLDVDRAAEAILSAVEGIDPGVDVVLEPGRYVVADAGVLLTRVNTVRQRPDRVERENPDGTHAADATLGNPGGDRPPGVVGCDAGLHTLARPAMFGTSHPVRNLAADPDDRVMEPTTVVGPVCSSVDRLCTARPLARPERGDLLAVGMSGAYGVELANRFHSRPLPTEVAVAGLAGGGSFDLRETRPVRNYEEEAGTDRT